MDKKALESVLQDIHTLAAVQTGRELSDGVLLGRFVAAKDEAAFTVLVERHGPMVLGVCRRALGHVHDAEDACQATFLVLARKAASIRNTASVSSWLHRVAGSVCANLKRERTRRLRREREAPAVNERDVASELSWREVQAALDEELGRLPERYRTPLILCYLEGHTRDEAAGRLGLTPGALHGRLERGRRLLCERLTRRGLTLAAALAAAAVGEGVARAALSPTFVLASARAAALLAGGRLSAGDIVSANVLILTREVLKSMFLTKLKIGMATVLCSVLLLAAVGGSLTADAAGRDTKPAVNEPAPKASPVDKRGAPAPVGKPAAAAPAKEEAETPPVELGELSEYFKVVSVKEEPILGGGGSNVVLRLEVIRPVDPNQFDKKYKIALFDKDNTLLVVQDANFSVPIRLEKGERLRVSCFRGFRLGGMEPPDWKKVVVRRTEAKKEPPPKK